MFKLVFDEKGAAIFKDVLETIQYILDECFLEISEKGLKIFALDRSHITFVGLELDQSFFEVFQFGGKEKFPIETEMLFKILELNLKEDIYYLEIRREDKSDELEIIFDGQDRRTFILKQFVINYEPPAPPELKDPDRAEVEVVSELFREQIIALEQYAEKILFELDGDKFIIEMDVENVKAKAEWIHGEPKLKNIRKMRCLYSGSKLKDITRKIISDSLKIEFETDSVLRITEEIPDGKLMFLLAPRIEAE